MSELQSIPEQNSAAAAHLPQGSALGLALDAPLRLFIEGLLNSYLTWAADFELQERVADLAKLPPCFQQWIDRIDATKLPWVAWQTNRGLVVATGEYDHEQSRRTGSWVLCIDWGLPPSSRNSSWWRSDPRRPQEWTAGRGRPAAIPV